MKAACFGYHRAHSVADAVALLSYYDGSARLLAGGQSLAPMLNMRLVRPDAVVDVNSIAELDGITVDRTGIPPGSPRVTIGALVRYSAVQYSGVVAELLPLLSTVVRHVGDRQVRNRGTIGGSLAQGDPTGEAPLACLTLDAVVHAAGPNGGRDIPVGDLYKGSYWTVLEPDEMITAVTFPRTPKHHAFAEFTRRHNDFAVIGVAAVGDHTFAGWSGVRVALGGVADTPVLVDAATALAEGTTLDDDVIAAVALAAAKVIDPSTDVRASADYRRHLTPIYVTRVLRALRESVAAQGAQYR